jgi:hypothetical protein
MGDSPSVRKLAGGTRIALLAALLVGSCTESPEAPLPEWDFVEGDPSQWVTIYDPRRTWDGYNLALYRARIPMLFDMNGRVVHAWPEARVRARLRLLPNGHLLAVSLSKGVVEFDWEGNEVWSFQPPRGIVHHDVLRLASGNTMMLILVDRVIDEVLEVNRAGEIVWRWPALHFMKPYIPPDFKRQLHLNSVQVLPENHWFDAGDERFRPGNLLLSARNLDRIAIVDRSSGKVVWTWTDRLNSQHEALMIPKGQPGAGNIQIFNNRYGSFYSDRRSEVLEIDPERGEVTWSFTDETFHSPTQGVEQSLPNGNVLIASSRGRRIFEVARDGAIVWQWTPPFAPVRPNRYAFDHNPQLAQLAKRRARGIRPPVGYRYIDPPVYRVARDRDVRKIHMDHKMRQFMARNDFCVAVLLPGLPTLLANYGVNDHRMKTSGVGNASVRFTVTWTPDGEPTEILFEDTLRRRGKSWHSRSPGMDRWAQRRGTLCIQTSVEGSPDVETEPFAYWYVPKVISGQTAEAQWETEEVVTLTEEEAKVRRQHLEALGYVD